MSSTKIVDDACICCKGCLVGMMEILNATADWRACMYIRMYECCFLVARCRRHQSQLGSPRRCASTACHRPGAGRGRAAWRAPARVLRRPLQANFSGEQGLVDGGASGPIPMPPGRPISRVGPMASSVAQWLQAWPNGLKRCTSSCGGGVNSSGGGTSQREELPACRCPQQRAVARRLRQRLIEG